MREPPRGRPPGIRLLHCAAPCLSRASTSRGRTTGEPGPGDPGTTSP